jgi:hypothetical protein
VRAIPPLRLSALSQMPGMSGSANMQSRRAHEHGTMGGMMGMPSSADLLSPMSQEASGTARLPSSMPMYGKLWMFGLGMKDMLMVHGDFHVRYTDVGSERGDSRIDAPNWFMGMYSHPLSAQSQLGLRGMFSLDPLTEGGNDDPLLYQTGETWHQQPLHDRQHSHDLFSELSTTYSQRLGPQSSAYLYLGYPGEPALGPPTYMHRLIALDLADTPIGHHWQDATHITWGETTAGVNVANRWKAEGSWFNGREPGENRHLPDALRLDSLCGRLSFNLDSRNAFQVSYGYLRNTEGDGVNQHRTSASWVYNRPLGDDANLTATLVWAGTSSRTRARRTRITRKPTGSTDGTRRSDESRTSPRLVTSWRRRSRCTEISTTSARTRWVTYGT